MTAYEDLMYLASKKTCDCVLWTGHRHTTGYGAIWVNGKRIKTHRLVMEHVLGRKLESDEVVFHTCKNKACVNPMHLVLEKDAKKGDKHHSTKLTDAQIKEIRELWGTGQYYQRELAAIFKVSRPHISDLVNEKFRVD